MESGPAPSPNRWPRWLFTIGLDVAFVLLAFGVPAVAHLYLLPSTEQGSAFAAEAAPPPLPDVYLIQSVCGPLYDAEKRDCYLDQLRPVLTSHGVSETFQLLATLATMDPYARAQDHQMAHALGRDAYLLFQDAPAIIAECPLTMHSGCTHGTVEAYLASASLVDPGDIPRLCRPVEAAGPFAYHQCLHGLGHGLAMALGHDLFRTLKYCDYLEKVHERGSCYDGAFMENIISFQLATGMLVGDQFGAHSHEGDETHNGTLKYDDPHWPCNAVEDHYKPRCYIMQTSAFNTLNGWNLDQSFAWCDEAQGPYIPICYQSMGRDISPMTNRDPARTLQQCGRGQMAFVPECVWGAVKEYITDAGSTDPAWPLCRLAEGPSKTRCYEAVGEYLIILSPAEDGRRVACQQAEPDYVAVCREAARV